VVDPGGGQRGHSPPHGLMTLPKLSSGSATGR